MQSTDRPTPQEVMREIHQLNDDLYQWGGSEILRTDAIEQFWRKHVGTAESLVRDLARALLPYRMEHSKNNCYYAGDAGPICDECQEVDRLLSRIPKELLP